MPPITREVRCASCFKIQPDQGQRSTCKFCGCFPLPSFTYHKTSSFHPVRCGCVAEVDQRKEIHEEVRKRMKPRKTPQPTLKL